MREIVSIININEFELISEDEIEKYTLLLEKHNIHALTLFVLQDKEGMSNKMQYMKDIFATHHIKLNIYVSDVFDGNISFYKASSNKRVVTCNDSNYVFVDLPYTDEFQDYLYDYLLSIIKSNYKPVLVNVEKHSYLINNEMLLKELIDLGCYVSVTFEDDNRSELINIYAKGLCHMMFSKFMIDPEKEKEFRFWLTYCATQYVADIVLIDNIRCMLSSHELAGISLVRNILKHPTMDSKLAENRWMR